MPPVVWHYGDPEVLQEERKHKLEEARKEMNFQITKHSF